MSTYKMVVDLHCYDCGGWQEKEVFFESPTDIALEVRNRELESEIKRLRSVVKSLKREPNPEQELTGISLKHLADSPYDEICQTRIEDLKIPTGVKSSLMKRFAYVGELQDLTMSEIKRYRYGPLTLFVQRAGLMVEPEYAH